MMEVHNFQNEGELTFDQTENSEVQDVLMFHLATLTLPFFPEEFHDVSLFCKVNLPTLTLPFFLQNFMTSLYFALQP